MRRYLDKRKGYPNWYICEYSERTRQRVRISTGTPDRAAAEKALAKHIIAQPQQGLISDATLLHVMLRYWEHHARKSFARDTAKRVLALVAKHEPATHLYGWSIPMQEEFAAKLSDKSSTRRRYFGVLKSAVSWGFKRGELPHMPPMLCIEAKDAPGVRPFSVAELGALCKAAQHDHERMLVLLCIATVARPGAVLELTWDRIDTQAGTADLSVPGRKETKKRRSVVPLAPACVAYLAPRRSLGPIVQWAGKQMAGHKMTFARIAKRAEVTGTAYGIRKAVAIWMRREGVPPWDVKGMLSHSLGGATDRYAHYDPTYMRAAADSINRLLREIDPPWLASIWPAPSDKSLFSVVADSSGAK